MKIKFKNILSWLFRDSLELNKYWWHRLVKVIFLSLFSIITIASYSSLVYFPDRELLSKHNIKINNTLYQFTENYNGEDSKNTIPDFFKQTGEFGLLLDNKIDYISEYSLGTMEEGTFCLKAPENYLDGVAKVLFSAFLKNSTDERTQNTPLSVFDEAIKKQFKDDPTRKCYFSGISKSDENLKKPKNLSSMIINYQPNFIFYIEATLAVPLIALFWFIIMALIYYRLILYIIYGNKK